MNSLELAHANPQECTAERLDEIKEDKLKVLEIISHERFEEYLKMFGIGEEHPLSPKNLFNKRIAKNTAESQVSQDNCDPVRLVPHYTSPWKNAILLALLAKGVDADYLTVAHYIATNFPFVERPSFSEDHKKGSIDYLVASIPDKSGIPIPRDSDIKERFQHDVSKIRKDIETHFDALRSSLGSFPANTSSN
jgi:hypothetical protein